MLLAWSGGKDAAWALHVVREAGCEVVALLTTLDHRDSVSAMQGVPLEILRAQAALAGLPLLESWQPHAADNTTHVQCLAATLAIARTRWPALRAIAFGDLALEDIRDWREATCAALGWQAHFPSFGRDTATLAAEMVGAGMVAQVCCVDTDQLGRRWLGHPYDAGLLATLPEGVDRCGERGEFHTCITAGPMFDGSLVVEGTPAAGNDRFARMALRLRAG
ncbi:MAG TPA: ATP-binding protein [Luteimonas sp.]|nr:ATP-binding protein [Luteimonas sp.]